MNGEAVLHCADVALYEAKEKGRNQTCWFDFQVKNKVIER
jgi:GGDEF domain-containing protein